MRRYWIEASALSGESVSLTGDTFHHIVNVCRMRPGSKFEVIVEGGTAYLVEMTTVGKKQAQAQVLESRLIPELPKPYLSLALCVPRFPVLESVIEKAVELGVKSIALLYSDFSFVRTQDVIPRKKMERWQRIIVSSTQQTGRGDLMELIDPQPLESFLAETNQKSSAMGLFAYEGEGDLQLKETLGSIDKGKTEELWTYIGGEGGFSDREVELFRASQMRPISLGPQVLRVETACTSLISIIKYDLDLMR